MAVSQACGDHHVHGAVAMCAGRPSRSAGPGSPSRLAMPSQPHQVRPRLDAGDVGADPHLGQPVVHGKGGRPCRRRNPPPTPSALGRARRGRRPRRRPRRELVDLFPLCGPSDGTSSCWAVVRPSSAKEPGRSIGSVRCFSRLWASSRGGDLAGTGCVSYASLAGATAALRWSARTVRRACRWPLRKPSTSTSVRSTSPGIPIGRLRVMSRVA